MKTPTTKPASELFEIVIYLKDTGEEKFFYFDHDQSEVFGYRDDDRQFIDGRWFGDDHGPVYDAIKLPEVWNQEGEIVTDKNLLDEIENHIIESLNDKNSLDYEEYFSILVDNCIYHPNKNRVFPLPISY